MAGAGTALSQDTLTAATNPAGLAVVGNRVDGGLALFSPRRSITIEGGDPAQNAQGGPFFLTPSSRDSRQNYFVIPEFGVNWQWRDDQTLGIVVFANGGMNTDYSAENGGVFFDGKAGVNLEQIFVAPTWTWTPVDNHSFGVSPLVVHQRFRATGLTTFSDFSSDPAALTNNGTDTSWGYGIQFGWQGQLHNDWRAGLSYRSRIRMDEFDRYKGLFAEQGGFDIPSMLNAGLAWSGIDRHWLLFDIQHIRYSEIKSIGNPLMPNIQTAQLGNNAGAGFGWQDMTIFKLGWQWQATSDWAWRAGLSYGEQPIPDSEVLFNILAPGVQEWHITTGFSHQLNDALMLSANAFYSPEKEVQGENPLGPGQDITLRMEQFGVAAGVSWTF